MLMLAQLNPLVQRSWRTGALREAVAAGAAEPGQTAAAEQEQGPLGRLAPVVPVRPAMRPGGQQISTLSGCRHHFPMRRPQTNPAPHAGSQMREGREWGAAFAGKPGSQSSTRKEREARGRRRCPARWAHALRASWAPVVRSTSRGTTARRAPLHAAEPRTRTSQRQGNKPLSLVCPSLHFLNSVFRRPKILNFDKG